jgi:hypothetical protein
VGDLNTAIEALQRARDAKLTELHAIEQALEALRAPMEGRFPLDQRTKDFEDLGITAAARRYLREQRAPRTTREIANALIAGGLKTNSKNWIATVYATLRNGKMFKRTKDKWELAESAP